MPLLAPDEIKEKIGAGVILGLSVDTSVFDAHGCDLDGSILGQLNQFHNSGVRLILSDVVAREVQGHIKQKASETQREIRSALHRHAKRWGISASASGLPFPTDEDPAKLAERQFSLFVQKTGARIVSTEMYAGLTAEVLERYFRSDHPFEESGKKKHEFPDAFALCSLEMYAKSVDCLILCVSSDTGWRRFCEASTRLAIVEDIKDALSYFNQSGRPRAEKIMNKIRSGEDDAFRDGISRAIGNRLELADFLPNCASSVDADGEPVSADLVSVDWSSISSPVVLAATSEGVTFSITLKATVDFEAIFHFEVRDGQDREYISLGSEYEQVREEIEFDVTVVASKVADEEFAFHEAEIEDFPLDVDFGWLVPFSGENPESDRY